MEVRKIRYIHPLHGVVGLAVNRHYTSESIGMHVSDQPASRHLKKYLGHAVIKSVEIPRQHTSWVSVQDIIVEFRDPNFWGKLSDRLIEEAPARLHQIDPSRMHHRTTTAWHLQANKETPGA